MSTVGSSLSSALTVLKGSGTGSLTDLRRGGPSVDDINAYAGVSGVFSGLALSTMVGLVKPVVQAPVTSAAHVVTPQSLTATATLTYSSDGSCSATNGGSGTWLLSGLNSYYEIYLNPTTGNAITSGTVNTWLALSSTRSWYNQVQNGIKTTSGNMYIRDTKAGVYVVSTTFSIDAESTP